MIQVGNILISADILEKKFICDLPLCRGYCCVQGDAGAPLNDDETLILEKEYNNFMNYVPEKGKKTITETGKWVYDWSNEKVTPLNNGQECAYSFVENNIYKCSIEKAWSEGKTNFRKPISCHLYPIRISNLGTATALNFHSWSVCQPAVILGNSKGIPVFRFLQEALTRAFGKEFFEELVDAARKWDDHKKQS